MAHPECLKNEGQRTRQGLDLRAADLRRVNLRGLPLARLYADMPWTQWPDMTEEQHELAPSHLEGADLKYAHLDGYRPGRSFIATFTQRFFGK